MKKMNFESKVRIQLKFVWVGLAILGIFCGYHELVVK